MADLELARKSFFDQTKGYLLILAFLMVERVFLQWLKDRFGCNEIVYAQFTQLLQDIEDLEKEIAECTQEIDRLKDRREMGVNMSRIDEERKNSDNSG